MREETMTMNTDLDVSRRDFLKAAGGGIAVFFWLGGQTELEAQGRNMPPGKQFNGYLRIGSDGKVTCFVGKVEMGQGIITSLAQMLAEELDVRLDAVEMVMGDTERCPFSEGTWGSRSTPYLGQPILRAAGAHARAVLMNLAADRLDVPRDRLVAHEGVIYDKRDRQKRVNYGALAQGQAIVGKVSQPVETKQPAEFQIIGKGVTRRDARAKVTGQARYTGDIRVANMVYARVLRPPTHDARLTRLDTSEIDRMEGTQVVRDDELVAVLHARPDLAEMALEKLKATYDIPPAQFDDETVFDYFMKNAGNSQVPWQDGDLEAGRKLADNTVEHTYLNGYVAHAAIETHTALAHCQGDRVTVWASTQAPFLLQDQIAGQLQMPREKVHVIAPFLGGGFGGKIYGRQAIQAVRIAQSAQRPVQLVWSRADEFFYDNFRNAAAVNITSGVDAAGKMVMWDCAIYGMERRGAELFYDVAHHRTKVYNRLRGDKAMHVLNTGAWRAPHANVNIFARESHIDALAAQAHRDPLSFRLQNISDERMRRVLRAGADKFGWTAAKTPSGRGVGLACGYDVGVPVALFAELAVNERTGHVQVKRVVCAQDLGLVINPDGARIQVEGAITMGLGYALTEEVHFKGGKVNDLDFSSYELPRFSWVPQIEAVILETDKSKPLGGGEPAIICMGAVIANAVHDAIGMRIPQMPLTRKRIKQALAKKKS